MGHVALDGTKIRARASQPTAMSYGRMQTAEPVAGRRSRTLAGGGHSPRRARGRGRWSRPARGRAAGRGDAHAAPRGEGPHRENGSGGCGCEAGTDGAGPLGSSATRPPGKESARYAPRPRAAQLPRSRQPDHAGAGRMHPRLSRPRGRRGRAAGDRGAGTDEPGARRAPTHADAGAQQSEHGPTGAGVVGGGGVLLRAQSHGVAAPPRARLRRHGAAATRGGLGGRRAHDRPEDTRPRDENPPAPRRAAPARAAPEAGGRTRGWSEHTGAWLQAVLVAGPVAGRGCVEVGLQGPHCAATGWCERMNPP